MSDPMKWIYQGGQLKVITVTEKAGNVSHNEVVPAGKRWIILYGMLWLTTDSNVGNRAPYLYFQNATPVFLWQSETLTTPITADATAALTVYNINTSDSPGGTPERANISFPSIDILDAGYILRITIAGGFAGDAYHGNFTVLEVNLP